MAVDKLLPIGTKVTVDPNVTMEDCFKDSNDRPSSDLFEFEAGVISEYFSENMDGTVTHTVDDGSIQRHKVANLMGQTVWVYDAMITELGGRKEMKCKKVTFTEIIKMIAEGTVPEGAKFIADDGSDAVISFDPAFCTSVLTWTDAPRNVQISAEVINATWYMETPEVKLSALEAMAELQKGKSVRGVYDGDEYTLSPYTDFDYIWDDSPWADMDDLLNKTDFYKVED
ncbi:hypothetical protein [Enterococcus gallinarum]|uniref:hypothetical protein n=1 Tax=Enterococcus gallinarum TaxID=1353 RepID=UPI001AD662BA|nr:hypothetical protein [Enterococcus gallinarum]MBO6417358.1 hypothetical protein [Enterococcus gallinarum]MBO6423397.1 hypothetical protein [Enterococcus gallinarum]